MGRSFILTFVTFTAILNKLYMNQNYTDRQVIRSTIVGG